MVFIQSLIGLALVGFASAAPMPDSAIGQEVAVSAPNGVVMSDTAALASQTGESKQDYATSSAMAYATSSAAGYGYGSSGSSAGYGYGSSGSSKGYGYGSSDSSKDYGYDSSSSSAGYGYGDSKSMKGYGYGASSSSSANMYESTSTMMYETSMAEATSTMMYETSMAEATSTMMYETSMADATSTMMTSASYATAMYGSGSSNWGGSGYQDCVNQCIASFGSPAASYMPTATAASMGSYGTGATHTVIVAPTQGVLRYVPFMVNASVGDTIEFMWGANNHTVTKGTSLGVCNRSENALFTSGEQNKSFVFTQVVNDTNPTFFYCATPGHCEKGMFGVLNMASSPGSNMSVSNVMDALKANNSDVSAMWSYTNSMTAGNPAAANWGANADMSGMPSWAQQAMVENVLYTRLMLAANPETLNSDGSVNLGANNGAPLMIPQDITSVLSAASSSSAAGASSTVAQAAAATSASAASPSSTQKSGARSVASSGAAVALTAGLAAFLLL